MFDRRTLTSLLVAFVFASPAVAFAASSGAAGPLPRWPAVVFGVVLAVAGLLAARPRKPWAELGKGEWVARVLGLTISTWGMFLTLFAVTTAPPLYSSTEALPWLHDIEVAQERAREKGQVMMIDFTAEWCNACHELEAEVFNQPGVSERLAEEVVLVKLDFDHAVENQTELLQRYEVSGLPRIAFVGADGELLRGPSFEGKLAPQQFLERLDRATSGQVDAGASQFEKTLSEQGLLAALLLVFIAGFLSSLTPCVYPLIPITIGIFGAADAGSRFKGFTLSLAYVLGIAITYSLLGVAAAVFGTVFGGAMQHPALKIGLGVLFVALGLSSLGAFSLRLPGDLQTKLSAVGGAGYVGAFLMGLVAGVIAAPCVGPIVAGVLVYVAQQQDILLGWSMLFVFALGLGVIFLVLGTFSSMIQRLPRSGSWMDAVKAVFGVVFFAMALYYLRYLVTPVTSGAEALWSWLGHLVA